MIANVIEGCLNILVDKGSLIKDSIILDPRMNPIPEVFKMLLSDKIRI